MFDQLHGRRWPERWRPGDEKKLAVPEAPVQPASNYRSDRRQRSDRYLERSDRHLSEMSREDLFWSLVGFRPSPTGGPTANSPVRPSKCPERTLFWSLAGFWAKISGGPTARQKRSDRRQRSDRSANAGQTGSRLGRAPLPLSAPTTIKGDPHISKRTE